MDIDRATLAALRGDIAKLREQVALLLAVLRAGEKSRSEALTMAGSDAAAFLGLSRSEFYRLVASGDLPAPVRFRGSNRSRWRRHDLIRAVDRMQPGELGPSGNEAGD